ncbi:unnamed protein product [Cladocopium goreaui]|uniref:Polynucleotide adenylyltransferase n=1 Tax=Cladocopium goreaui TaxID=2562237 RepID=A0A9P1DBU6_9DINO|nr:unnamed protein product [Cladocopium goreaui]
MWSKFAAAFCSLPIQTGCIRLVLGVCSRICAKIQNGAADWNHLFASSKFFERHFHFLQIDITAANDAIMSQWLLWCRRHLQGVAEKLEAVRTCQLHTRPWPVWVPFKDPDWHAAKTLFIALRIEPPKSAGGQTGARPVVDLREVLVNILEKLCAWPYATKHIGEFDLYIRHMSQPEALPRNGGVCHDGACPPADVLVVSQWCFGGCR